MSGYTPLFSSLLDGTLYGKWPHTGIWACLLSQVDKQGHIDMVPQLLAAKIGVPLQTLTECIQDFMQPDPGSRSKDADGRRLELIEPDARDWGWRVVNHKVYRQKATGQRQIDDGRNADKVKRYKSRHRETPQDTQDTSRHTSYSDAESYTNTDSDKNPTARKNAPTDDPQFLDFKLAYPTRAGDQGWRKALRAANARLQEGHAWEEMIAGAKRYAEYIRSTGNEGTEYVKQAASFLGPDKPFTNPWKSPNTKADNRLTSNLTAAQEFMRRTEPT